MRPDHVIVMGVSGVGKTTVAEGLARITGWDLAEGDQFHPQANVDKMASGVPLTDEDRWPWLRSIGDWISAEAAEGRSAVITCSALRRSYRDLLREGRPSVRFCHLVAGEDLVAERVAARTDHFMPPSLLHSQYETLEPLEADEPGVRVPIDATPDEVVRRAAEALGLERATAERAPTEL
ncbi:MAG: gluconokinase [Nocardioides sp.]|uniref:gluconokinase n=1 Tax=Nocardioides sp. TaxID=35761 RepID=UPI003F0455D4